MMNSNLIQVGDLITDISCESVYLVWSISDDGTCATVLKNTWFNRLKVFIKRIIMGKKKGGCK